MYGHLPNHLPRCDTPTIEGFVPDYASIVGKQVDHNSADLYYIVKYAAQNTPEQPVEPTPGPETPSEPVEPESPVVPETPVENQPVEKPVGNNKLPQTGATDTTAIAGLGLLTAMMSLLGLGKRKRQ